MLDDLTQDEIDGLRAQAAQAEAEAFRLADDLVVELERVSLEPKARELLDLYRRSRANGRTLRRVLQVEVAG